MEPLPPRGADSVNVFFLADSQIHNIYGRQIRSSTVAVNNVASSVAVRPPVLNILAPLVLEAFLREGAVQASRMPVPSAPIPVYLGDAANLACSSEFETFEAVMNTHSNDHVWLMAHGNHDSFMIGTSNKWIPSDDPDPGQLSDLVKLRKRIVRGDFAWEVAQCSDPWALSWWTPEDTFAYAFTTDDGRSWPQVCGRPRLSTGEPQTAVPMTKLVWLAYYLQHLRRIGVEVEEQPSVEERCPPGSTRIVGNPKVESRLGAADYRMIGCWVPPRNVNDIASDSALTATWDSFLVQSLLVAPKTRLVIIDTSTTEVGESELREGLGEAGNHGRISGSQMKVIGDVLAEAHEDHERVLVSGHVVIDELLDGSDFVDLLNANHDFIDGYVSAHSHDHWNTRLHQGELREFNVGSVTDWPMEAALLSVSPASFGNNADRLRWSILTMSEHRDPEPSLGNTTSVIDFSEWSLVAGETAQRGPADFTWSMEGTRPLSLIQSCVHAASMNAVFNRFGDDIAAERNLSTWSEHLSGADCDETARTLLIQRMRSHFYDPGAHGQHATVSLEQVAFWTRMLNARLYRAAGSRVVDVPRDQAGDSCAAQATEARSAIADAGVANDPTTAVDASDRSDAPVMVSPTAPEDETTTANRRRYFLDLLFLARAASLADCNEYSREDRPVHGCGPHAN